MTQAAATTIRVDKPFPGLRPFEERDQYLFFGRESQVDTMIDKLAATHFLAVVGTSGSGKSSLVNCGLKPALRRGLMSSAGTSWRMAYVRPGGDPIKALAQALVQPDGPDDPKDPDRLFRTSTVGGVATKDIVEASLRMSKFGLVDSFEQAHLDDRTNLLLIADQFEELFRYRNLPPSSDGDQSMEEQSVAFVNLLLEAASSQRRIYVVLTMRSDFLGDCAQFFGLPEAINRGQYLVPRMSRDERRSAIEGPVKVAGAEMTPVLLTRLVNDVGDNPDQLSILQHALNRTWAYWRGEGGQGPVDLPHYVAIGTMSEALDRHAEKAYSELRDDGQNAICEMVFQAITDKGTDARGIRRPTRADTLCAIAGVSLEDLTAVLSVFRKPSRSFVMPPASKTINSETVIDISHESLMRIWNRLKAWVDDEAESASQYQRLVENAQRHARSEAGLMPDPELSVMLDWQQKRHPTATWAERYRPGFDSAVAFLDESRKARDAAIEAEKQRLRAEQERQRRELVRTRVIAAVLGLAFVLAVGSGIYAVIAGKKAASAQSEAAVAHSNEASEKALREQSDAAAKTQKQLADEREVARQAAQKAEAEAQDADARAELERKMVVTAINAQAAAQLAGFDQLEKEEILQTDSDAKKDASTLDRDKQLRNAALTKTQDLTLDAAHKSAEAAAIVANARLLSPSQISGTDLFDVAHGTEVIDWSGRNPNDKAIASQGSACGEPSSVTRDPGDMFSGSRGSPCRATVFADKLPVGTEHFIQWKTKNEVTLQSVALFAAHDKTRLRRSFSEFKLYVKKQGQWALVKEYSPNLSPAFMYGGSCGAQGCFPSPAIKYTPGAVLASCINVPPTTGQEFRAVFVQSVSSVERYSGPRVLQLDGYPNANCAK